MTYLEALFGSQYHEIQKQGKDGSKGRLNANLFLSALIILFLFALFLVCFIFVPHFKNNSTRWLTNIFGSDGRATGKLLAIPLLAIIYFIVSNTVGNRRKFDNYNASFMNYPDEIKARANIKLLLPFFILLFLVFGLAMFITFG